MIKGYRDKDTERLAAGENVRQWKPFRRQAEKRLRILDAAGIAQGKPEGAVFHTDQ